MKEDNIWKDMNWGMIGVGVGSIAIWYCIFTIGFFTTLLWVIIFSAVVGIWLRVSGRG